eukprot:TRINITY_DN8939_c0_g1_i1.p2 TRINITY_DN8939_c0_g1~~TRINITY_DN8939_c0_g1_i1.p2  ORF type:complete len:152 (-),score=10.98 TRINITY_DN8939_c0_g1_i1:30-485(-)
MATPLRDGTVQTTSESDGDGSLLGMLVQQHAPRGVDKFQQLLRLERRQCGGKQWRSSMWTHRHRPPPRRFVLLVKMQDRRYERHRSGRYHRPAHMAVGLDPRGGYTVGKRADVRAVDDIRVWQWTFCLVQQTPQLEIFTAIAAYDVIRREP